MAESRLDPKWDAPGWLMQGPDLQRLEVIENLNDNKMLLAAVRKCARETKDRSIQYWARFLKEKRIATMREMQATRA